MLRLSKPLVLFGIGVIALVLFAFIFRLANLTEIPIFADEAIYIRWAQVMRAEPTLRFVPLSDGKQPLFMWTVIPFLKLFQDPLIAGRMVSVLSGVSTLLGIIALNFIISKSKKSALFSGFLYALSPFVFFFDRMALVDSMLAMFGVWFFVFLILAIQKMRFDFAMLSGFMLAGSLLTKSPGLFFALMTPLSVFFLRGKEQPRILTAAKVAGIWITTFVIGYGLSQIMRLGPNYHMIAIRNLDYVFPFDHILQNPRDPFIYNIDRALEWLVALAPFELLIAAVGGYFVLVKKKPFQAVTLVLLFAFPFLVGSMYSKAFTARYILYTLPPLFVLGGFVTFVKAKYVIPFALLFALHSMSILTMFWQKPVDAPLPQSERSGYFQEWSAGWGIAETAALVRKEALLHPDEKIVIGTEGYFGTLPDGLQVYLEKVPNVTIIGTGLNFKKIPDSLIASKQSGNKTYFVVNSSRLNEEFKKEGLNLLYSYVKPARTPGTHEYVQSGPQETYYFFELK